MVEIPERIGAHGEIVRELDETKSRRSLQAAFDNGIRAIAIALVHGYRYHDHEVRVAQIAKEIGFTQISVSHEVSPMMKLISRGDTAVVDAYLSPILRRYVDRVAGELGATPAGEDGPTLESPGFIRRSDREVDPRVREAAFSLPSPENDTRRLDVTATADGRVALVMVDGVRAGDDSDSATPREQFAEQQRQYVARQEYGALNAYLRNQADVEINENRID